METDRWMTDEEVDALMRAQKPYHAVLPNLEEGYYHYAPDGGDE